MRARRIAQRTAGPPAAGGGDHREPRHRGSGHRGRRRSEPRWGLGLLRAAAGSAGAVAIAAAVVATASAPARAGLPLQPDPRVEAQLDSLLRQSIVQLYDGRLDLAAATVEDAAAAAPDDPRIGLFRFRVQRVNYPDDIHEKERARRELPAQLLPLDQAIAATDSILALDERRAAAYLYRGWARMMKAQLHAIASEYWSAASESKKGKKDLDRFLKLHPQGDPDADAILGGYLYFSDILPGVVKFLKWIIRIPGGDKDRGLELLAAAAASDGYTATDSRLVLGVIDYLFEGQVRQGATIFTALAREFPLHPRVVELAASTSLLYPEMTPEAIALESRLIERWGTEVRGWDDLFLERLRWSRARLRRQTGQYGRALEELQAIAGEAPEQPYWLTPRAYLGLIDLELDLGRSQAAAVHCRMLLDNETFEKFHEAAERSCERRPDPRQVAIFTELGPARQALFAGRHAEARRLLEDIRARHGADLRLRFFEGELERLLARFDEAETAYREVAKASDEGPLRSLRMIALLRLGELHIDRQRYDDAQLAFKEAREMEPRATMLGNMIRGRLLYLRDRAD